MGSYLDICQLSLNLLNKDLNLLNKEVIVSHCTLPSSDHLCFQFWTLEFRKNMDKLGNIQRRTTRVLKGVKSGPCEDCLNKLFIAANCPFSLSVTFFVVNNYKVMRLVSQAVH